MSSEVGSSKTGTKTGAAFGKVVDVVIALVKLVGGVFALVLVGHILLTLFSANPENPITTLLATAARALVLWFEGLFTPDDPTLAVTVNYGLAAVFWLVAAAVITRLLRAVR